jgi:Periplasmic serine proteases (ClpP class)
MASNDSNGKQTSFIKKALNTLNPLKLWGGGPVVPVLRLSGTIGAVTPLRPGLTLSACANVIERAFSVSDAPAVALQINSPGGSPVQSRMIFQRIRDLAREKKLPVYAFIEDVAASGGYELAIAADEIYADPASIIGSIGVIAASFGFVELMQKIGVERRVYTAGERKLILDPFQPVRMEDVERIRRIQSIIHKDFIDLVKERRGRKIEAAGDSLFTGEFWTGREALELGLIDGIMDIRSKMRERFGEEVRLRLVPMERGLFRRRTGIGIEAQGGFHGLGDEIISSLEARALWAKYGL